MTASDGDRHKIRSLIFDLRAPTWDACTALEQRFKDLARDAVPDALESVLRDFDPDQAVLSLDRIELDLGQLAEETSEAEICNAVKQRLKTLLEAETRNLRQSKQSDGTISEAGMTLDHLEQFLHTGTLPWNASAARFRDLDRLVLSLMASAGDTFVSRLPRLLSSEAARLRWFDNLHDETLFRIACRIAGATPEQLASLRAPAEWLRSSLADFGTPVTGRRFLYEPFFEEGGAPSAPPQNLVTWWLRTRLSSLSFPSSRRSKEWRTSMQAELEPVADTTGGWKPVLLQSLQEFGDPQPNSAEAILPQPAPQRAAGIPKPSKTGDLEPAWFVSNAGLVLLWPYLSRYFENLKLVRKGRFIGRDHQQQAVRELDHLGRPGAGFREFDLVLAKVLCGLPPETPLAWEAEFKPLNCALADDLLRQVIKNWKALGGTSIAGLRSSFLVREGKLTREPDSWSLWVEQKSFDVLLSLLPYSTSVVKLPWTPEPVFVQWSI